MTFFLPGAQPRAAFPRQWQDRLRRRPRRNEQIYVIPSGGGQAVKLTTGPRTSRPRGHPSTRIARGYREPGIWQMTDPPDHSRPQIKRPYPACRETSAGATPEASIWTYAHGGTRRLSTHLAAHARFPWTRSTAPPRRDGFTWASNYSNPPLQLIRHRPNCATTLAS